jgi:RNA polymerase sigma-70 factor (ECF subfamily)
LNSETALIAAAKRGSVRAFSELIAGYRVRLLRFLLTRASSYADAEDILQDTLINAYRYLQSYDAKWRFSTWLYRIALNNIARTRSLAVDDAIDVADLGDAESGPLELCIAAAERQNLWVTAKRVLNEDAYTAMWLRYVEDMSVNDIAAVLDRSISWTKVNLMRARKELEVELNRARKETSRAYG